MITLRYMHNVIYDISYSKAAQATRVSAPPGDIGKREIGRACSDGLLHGLFTINFHLPHLNLFSMFEQ